MSSYLKLLLLSFVFYSKYVVMVKLQVFFLFFKLKLSSPHSVVSLITFDTMALGQKQMDADIGLKMDIIAAGSIGPCKSEHRATFMSPNAEGAYWDCISNFSTQYLPVYGSKEKSGFTYYFERGGKSSWERPAPLQRIIQV